MTQNDPGGFSLPTRSDREYEDLCLLLIHAKTRLTPIRHGDWLILPSTGLPLTHIHAKDLEGLKNECLDILSNPSTEYTHRMRCGDPVFIRPVFIRPDIASLKKAVRIIGEFRENIPASHPRPVTEIQDILVPYMDLLRSTCPPLDFYLDLSLMQLHMEIRNMKSNESPFIRFRIYGEDTFVWMLYVTYIHLAVCRIPQSNSLYKLLKEWKKD